MTSLPAIAKELVVAVVVLLAVVISSGDSDVCSLRPVFNSREHSATFLASEWYSARECSVRMDNL